MLIFLDESRCSLCGAAALGGTCLYFAQTHEKGVVCAGIMRIDRLWAGALRGMAGGAWTTRRWDVR